MLAGLPLAEKIKIFKGVKPSRIKYDECGVNNRYEILNEWNVFEEPDNQVSLSSAKQTPLYTKNDQERAEVVRKSCLQKFVE